jgi:hypothetical protein
METIMTMQSLSSSSSLLASAQERGDRSLWRRLVAAIAAGRERKADREIARYLRSHQGSYRDDFRIELERRFLGQ